MGCFVFHKQSELERIEEEQTLEELQILRAIVHESFRKQEEIAEVSVLLCLFFLCSKASTSRNLQ